MGLVLSSLLQVGCFAGPVLCLLDGDSGFFVGLVRRRVLFAGFVAARGTVMLNWFAPRMCGKAWWIHGLLRMVACGCAAVGIDGAGPSIIDASVFFFLWHA